MKWSKFGGSTIDTKEYDAFKDSSINSKNIVRKNALISDIDIISSEKILYKGVEFSMNENAFKNLITIFKLSIGVMDNIDKMLGDTVTASLLTMMKKAISKNGASTICMIFNKKIDSVTGFSASSDGILSNESFFDLFEQTMNINPGMDIKNIAISPNGEVDISVLNNNWEFGVEGFNDEYFKSGLNFRNTSNMTIVSPFNERLICTNGMIADTYNDMSIILNKTNDDIGQFFSKVTNLEGMKGFEDVFKGRIKGLINTQASLAELTNVHNVFDGQIRNNKDAMVASTLESFIPYKEVRSAFKREQISLNDLDVKQKQKIRTGVSVWDLINGMTDLASHPTKYGLKFLDDSYSVSILQRAAGNLAFKKEHDLSSPIKQIF